MAIKILRNEDDFNRYKSTKSGFVKLEGRLDGRYVLIDKYGILNELDIDDYKIEKKVGVIIDNFTGEKHWSKYIRYIICIEDLIRFINNEMWVEVIYVCKGRLPKELESILDGVGVYKLEEVV